MEKQAVHGVVREGGRERGRVGGINARPTLGMDVTTVVSRVTAHLRVSAYPHFLMNLWFVCINVACTNGFFT